MKLHPYPHHQFPVFSNVYLHGEMEDYFGFDLVCIEGEVPAPGIYETAVELPGDRLPMLCSLYFWESEAGLKGLIVAPMDMEAIAYAEHCYNSHAFHL